MPRAKITKSQVIGLVDYSPQVNVAFLDTPLTYTVTNIAPTPSISSVQEGKNFLEWFIEIQHYSGNSNGSILLATWNGVATPRSIFGMPGTDGGSAFTTHGSIIIPTGHNVGTGNLVLSAPTGGNSFLVSIYAGRFLG